MSDGILLFPDIMSDRFWKIICSPVSIKFGEFMSYYKRKNFIKNFLKNCDQKTSSRPFCVCKELKRNLYWKMKFLKEAADIRLYISKTIKMCPNQYTDLLRFLFTGDSLKIKRACNYFPGHIFHRNFW